MYVCKGEVDNAGNNLYILLQNLIACTMYDSASKKKNGSPWIVGGPKIFIAQPEGEEHEDGIGPRRWWHCSSFHRPFAGEGFLHKLTQEE